MPDRNSFGPVWTLLFKAVLVVVPLTIPFYTWLVVQQFKDINHREAPHATVPVEMETVTELKIQVIEMRGDVTHIKEDVGEIKKKLANQKATM